MACSPSRSRGQRLTDEQRQRVAILRDAACLLRDVDLRFAPRGLGAMQVDLARHAGSKRSLVRSKDLRWLSRVSRASASSSRSAINVSHALATSETSSELRRGARLLETEVVLERGAAQAAHAAEQVELERADAKPAEYVRVSSLSPVCDRLAGTRALVD
jgi:hypothetical protein